MASRLNHSLRRTILWTLNSCLFTCSKSQKVSRDSPTTRFQQNLAYVHQALLLARRLKNSKRKICHDPILRFILLQIIIVLLQGEWVHIIGFKRVVLWYILRCSITYTLNLYIEFIHWFRCLGACGTSTNRYVENIDNKLI